MSELLILSARVDSLNSGAKRKDKKPGATISIDGGPFMRSEIDIDIDDSFGLKLDQTLKVTISTDDDASGMDR